MPKGTGNLRRPTEAGKAVKENSIVAERLLADALQERRWDRYPSDVMAALPKGLLPAEVFGGNAKRCFVAWQKVG